MNKGFHSGCIDCVIPVGNTLEDSKWWVIDWKSNLISGSNNSDCLPRNYNYENMRNEMIKHHYPLQSHLYLLALHRFCLLYTSPSPRDKRLSRMPSSA